MRFSCEVVISNRKYSFQLKLSVNDTDLKAKLHVQSATLNLLWDTLHWVRNSLIQLYLKVTNHYRSHLLSIDSNLWHKSRQRSLTNCQKYKGCMSVLPLIVLREASIKNTYDSTSQFIQKYTVPPESVSRTRRMYIKKNF